MWEITKKPRPHTLLGTTPFTDQHKLALTRIETGEDTYIRVSCLGNRCFTCTQQSASSKEPSQYEQRRGYCGTVAFQSEIQRNIYISNWPRRRRDWEKTDYGQRKTGKKKNVIDRRIWVWGEMASSNVVEATWWAALVVESGKFVQGKRMRVLIYLAMSCHTL